jgi:Suppressor of fused protein (SUFU)
MCEESRSVDFHSVFDATESEAAVTREHGGDKLVDLQKSHGAFAVTDPKRSSPVVGR